MEINEELSLFTLYNKIKEETSLIILNDNKLNGGWKFVGQDLLSITKNGDSLIFKADGSALRNEIQRLDNEIDNLENSIDTIDDNFINHNHNDGADLGRVDAIKLGGKSASEYVLKANLKQVATTGDYNDLINIPDIAKTDTNGLMSAEDKRKLNSIAEGANNYIHPTYTPRSSGLYKIKVDDTGHVSDVITVTKADITGLGIPENDTDTHYTSTIIVSDSATNKEPKTNIIDNIYINHIENNEITNSIKITGSGYTAVGVNASGDIVIDSGSITYSAGEGIHIDDKNIINTGVRSIATGSANGTISVNTNGSSANVEVYGLKSAAYTDSEEYALASHGNHVPDIAQQGDNTTFLRNDNTWAKVTPANIGAANVVHNHTSLTDVTSISGDANQEFEISGVSSISGTDLTISGDSLYISNILPATDDIKIGNFDEEFKQGYFEQLYVYTINGYDRSDNPLLKINSYEMTIDVDEKITINGDAYIRNIYGTGSDETSINIQATDVKILASDSLTLEGDDGISISGNISIASYITPKSNNSYDIGSANRVFANGYFTNLNANNLILNSTKTTLKITTRYEQNEDYDEYFDTIFNISGVEDESEDTNSIYRYKFTSGNNENEYCIVSITGRLNANLTATKQLRLAKNDSNTIWFHNYSQNILRVNTSANENIGNYVQADFTNKNITAPNFNLGTSDDRYENIYGNNIYTGEIYTPAASSGLSIHPYQTGGDFSEGGQLNLIAASDKYRTIHIDNYGNNTNNNTVLRFFKQTKDSEWGDLISFNFNVVTNTPDDNNMPSIEPGSDNRWTLGAINKKFHTLYTNNIYTRTFKNGSGYLNIIPTDLSGIVGETDNTRIAYDTALQISENPATYYYTYEGSQINLNCKAFITDNTTQIKDANSYQRTGFSYFFKDAEELIDINSTVLSVDRPICIDNYLVGDKSLIYDLNNMQVQDLTTTNKVSIISRQLRLFTCKKDTLKIDFANYHQETVNNQTVWVTRGVIAGNENQYWDLGDSNHYFGSLYVGNSRIPASDYAEMFEWEDGNVNNEDRVGYMVTLKDDKIIYANENDDILGVISANPGIIGNMDDGFKRRYVKDEFERYIYQEKEIVNENGDKSVIKEKIETDIYDPTIPYQTREVRSEWDIVGLVGMLCVRDDGTCKVGEYCKPFKDGIVTYTKDRYRSYNDNGDIIKVKNYKVLERTGKNVVKIFLRD